MSKSPLTIGHDRNTGEPLVIKPGWFAVVITESGGIGTYGAPDFVTRANGELRDGDNFAEAVARKVAEKLSRPRGEGLPERRFITTAEAATYCGYRSVAGLKWAKRKGLVTSVGGRGGLESANEMWALEELDRFLSGTEKVRGKREADRVQSNEILGRLTTQRQQGPPRSRSRARPQDGQANGNLPSAPGRTVSPESDGLAGGRKAKDTVGRGAARRGASDDPQIERLRRIAFRREVPQR
jgi:hypothetical protein